MRAHRLGDRGFTMLEVIVASTILLVVLGIAFTATDRVSQHAKLGSVQSQMRSRGRATITRIVRELEQSSIRRIYREDTPGSKTFNDKKVLTAGDGTVTNVQFELCVGAYSAANLPVPNPDKIAAGDPRYDPAPRGYRWDSARQRLMALIPGGQELLVLTDVSSFGVSIDVFGSLTVSVALTISDVDRKGGAPIKVFETALMTSPMNPK
jgi:prepilin-type N-terminal cleavage/methylation domain-containing protein